MALVPTCRHKAVGSQRAGSLPGTWGQLGTRSMPSDALWGQDLEGKEARNQPGGKSASGSRDPGPGVRGRVAPGPRPAVRGPRGTKRVMGAVARLSG